MLPKKTEYTIDLKNICLLYNVCFGYPRTLNYVQNLLSMDFSHGYRRIRYFLKTKKGQKKPVVPDIIGFDIRGIVWD